MGPVFELFATLGLKSDDFDAGLDDSSKKASSFGDKLKSGLATAAKVGGAALAAASTAAAKLGADAVKSYADYEQLVGGVQTLFGVAGMSVQEYAEQQGMSVEEAMDGYLKLQSAEAAMLNNAQQAFKTAGLNANEYMETAIQSGASLISSLGGDTSKAAELMDVSITDMADNVNKMGTSMESIQNAYRGFAKANFTMLDNLALGYGGTKEEMQRLLTDATALSGVEYDISSFADIVQAIHVVQTELGITGTTAKESSGTISGSLASLKSAWQNLLVGMADGSSDLSGLISNVVSGAETVFENILPVAEHALEGVATLVEKIAPVIAEKLPGVVETVLPSVLNAATSLVAALAAALPTILQVLIEQGPVIINQLISTVLAMLPEIVQLGLTLLTSLAQGIADNLDELIPTIVDVVLQIVDTLTDPETLGNLVDAAIAIIIALADGLIDALPKLIEKAPEIVMNLVDALVEAAPKLATAALTIIVELVKALIENLPELFKAGGQILGEIVHGIIEMVSRIDEAASEVIDSFIATLEEWDPLQWGKDLVQNLIDGIKEGWNKLKSGVSDFAQGIADFLGFSEPKVGPLSNFHTYAPDMMQLFAKGIAENEDVVYDQIRKSFDFGDVAVSPVAVPAAGAASAGTTQQRGEATEPQTINLVFNGSLSELARVLYPEIEYEGKRIGVNMVTA